MVPDDQKWVCVSRISKEKKVYVSSSLLSEWERKRLSLIGKKWSSPINNKKKKKKLCVSPINKKKELWFSSIGKRSKKQTSSTYNKNNKKRKKVRRFNGELKDMKKLSSNDEAFRLSWKTLSEIIDTIRSRKTPTPETYWQWDEYAISFYLKMCTCFGVDYQHLEATPPQLQGFVDGVIPPLPEGMSLDEHLARTSVGFVLRTLSWADGVHFEPKKHMDVTGPIQIIQPATEEMSFDEYVHQVGRTLEIIPSLSIINGAFDFGFYSPGTGPERIPYHLYLLLKEAVYIMSNTNDEKDLKMVEEKICFFMTYFHSHLPPGFRYKRRTAYYDVDSYHSTRYPRYEVGGYTLYRFDALLMWGWDPRTRLTPQCMVDIMNVIYSRKTPSFWRMSCNQISFYCKLCSCFGIEYDRLEGASEDAVCLMNMRRN